MFGAEPGLAQREQVLQERQGQIKPAGIFVGRGEVMHDLERAGVVGAEVGFHELERILQSRQDRVGVVGAVLPVRRGLRLLQEGRDVGPQLGERLLLLGRQFGQRRRVADTG